MVDDLQVIQAANQVRILGLRQEVKRASCLNHHFDMLLSDSLALDAWGMLRHELVDDSLEADFQQELVLLDIF